ncbi:hypothetical protein MTO96_017717 [Rhipicephalus appendiculatus]
MGHRKRIREEQLGFEDEFPGVNLNIPCSAQGGGDDYGRGIPTSFCHILDRLSRWNRLLWHVGLQLRELRGPGKLSLVRLHYRGSGGVRQQARSHGARILFHVLLVQHRSIRGELFKAISTMTNLRELVVLGSSEVPMVLLDAICLLLVYTMSLTTLSMPGLVFDEQSGKFLISALRRNDSVENLSLHGSIMHSYLPSGLSRFSRFLGNSPLPTNLSVEGERSDPESTYADLYGIIAPLVFRGNLQKLRLAGYLLNSKCAALFATLVSRSDGGLESLDISGCRWRTKPSPEGRDDAGSTDGEQMGRPAVTQSTCPWLQAFDHSARVELSFLALSFGGMRLHNLWAFLNTAITVESLQVISLRDVSRQNLNQVCRVIRDTGMSGRVRLEGFLLVDYPVLIELRDFPEELRKVAICSVGCASPKVFGDMVHLAYAWYHVTAFKMLLTQDVLSDVRTIHKLSKCFRGAVTLMELVLVGFNRPDLERTLRPGCNPQCVLLDAIFANRGIEELRLNGIRLGQANLWFLAEKLVTSETLCRLSFASWDPDENDALVQLLAADIRENDVIVDLRVAESASVSREKERFVVDDVVGRNLGYITCAAFHVVHEVDLPRCVNAHGVVSESHFLKEKVKQLRKELKGDAESDAGEGGRSVPTSICHVFDHLSRWNYVLWHVGLQLREVRGPGKLSLVRVFYRGRGGCRQRARSRDARILFHVLLVTHRCVESLHLDEALIEGSGLGEYREVVVSALEMNTSLRTLTIGSLFNDYKGIREDLFIAISTMTHLRELVVLCSGAVEPILIDAVCPLLEDTQCLVTLSMPGIVLDEESATLLTGELIHNDTIEDLSVHVSILLSYFRNGVSIFSRFLACSMLTSLSVQGVHADTKRTWMAIERIVGPLILRGELEQLRLTGFLLDAECAALLAEVVSHKEGRLRSLDISGCRWRIPKSWPELQPAGEATRGEEPGRRVVREPRCLWLQAFDYTAKVGLSCFALSMAGLRPDDLHALFNVAITVESLQMISLRDVSRNSLMQVCQAIRESGLSGRVRLEGSYLVDSPALAELREFPEALRRIAISSVDHPSPRAFEETVHLACSSNHVTTLMLLLTREVLSDVPTFHKLSKCLSTAVSLRELALVGSNRPDLDVTLKSGDPPHSVILDVISANAGIRALQLSGLRLGDQNLWFLIDAIVSSGTLSEVSFVSWDPEENDCFLHLLADEFRENKSVTKLLLRALTDGVDEEWFVVEDVISRNTGYLTCAAHFVVGTDHSLRSEAAYETVGGAPALVIKVEELAKEFRTAHASRNTSEEP